MAAAARPEPVRSGLEPGLPLGFQRITYPRLVASVQQNRNSERPHFCLITGFRDIHPPDRGRLMRAYRGVHLHRHLGPCLAGQRDQPIDPRSLAARIALRDLAHAYQRVMPAAQHQLLQVHSRSHVPFLHRLEDPASQPPYLLLAAPPVHMLPGVAVESREYRPGVLRSVHRGVQLILWFGHLLPFRFKGFFTRVTLYRGTIECPGIRRVLAILDISSVAEGDLRWSAVAPAGCRGDPGQAGADGSADSAAVSGMMA